MNRVVLAVVFALYCAVVITGAAMHEPWWDEAQSWLIARDASLGELLTHVVRYEGHPPLWYLLLAIPAKLGLPYWTMKVIAVLAGCATVLLLLYGFPRVPLYLRIVAPFAFFLAYQYTVVARSYVLLGPILLAIARIWNRRHERFGTFITLLILLSHVSVHGFAIACALYVASLRRNPQPATRTPHIAFVLNSILLIALLWPPTDGASHVDLRDPFSLQRYVVLISSIVPGLFWGPSADETTAQAVAIVCGAMIALGVLVFWFARTRAAVPFLFGAAAVFFVSARYYSMWHEGIFFLLLLFAMVLAFEHGGTPRGLEIAAQVVLVLLLLRHAQWTFQSLAYDMRTEYTGSARAAEFLAGRGLDRKVVYGAGVAVVELQPYFEKNLFANNPTGHAYWEWSPRNDWPYGAATPAMRQTMADWFRKQVQERPDVIVCGIGFREDHLYAKSLLRFPGYRPIGAFSGTTFWKTRPSRFIAFQIFQRVDTPPASAPRSGAR